MKLPTRSRVRLGLGEITVTRYNFCPAHGTLEGDPLGALLARVRKMVADPPNQA